MDDDDGGGALDVADLKDERGLGGSDDHREAVAQISSPDRVSIGVEDFFFCQSVLEGRLRNDRFFHHSKLFCHSATVHVFLRLEAFFDVRMRSCRS